MPLSEHEQRILDEIERRLAAEDPKFARSTAVATPRGVGLKRIKRGVGGFVLGLGVLIAAMMVGIQRTEVFIPIGIVAFAVMLLSVNSIARASKQLGRGAMRSKGPTWFAKHEERWRKRFDRGDER